VGQLPSAATPGESKRETESGMRMPGKNQLNMCGTAKRIG